MKTRLLITIVLLCAMALTASAQSKPKWEKYNKPQTSVSPAPKDKAASTSHPKKTTKAKRKSRNQRRQRREATYLTVNNTYTPQLFVGAFSGTHSLPVSTDGRDWDVVYGSGNWYRAYKESGSELEVAVDYNPTHYEREGSFMVQSDNQSVWVHIKQSASPITATARIESVTLSHNAWNNYTYCLAANVRVSITGAMGIPCFVVGFVKDANGNYISGSYNYSNYRNNSGLLCTSSQALTPSSDGSTTFNVTLYIPNNAIEISKKKATLLLELMVYCQGTDKYINAYNTTTLFKIKKKKHSVTTY